MNPPPNAWHALGGIWRLSARRFSSPLYWFTTLALLAALAVLAIASFGSDPKQFFPWATAFYLRVLVPMLAFISMAGALRDDLKPGVADYLFTRPLRKPLYLLFRYLSQTALLFLDFLFAFLLLTALALLNGVPDLPRLLPLLLLGQILLLLSFGALGLLCGVLTSRYVIVGVIYGAVVEIGLGSIPTALNELAITRRVIDMLLENPLTPWSTIPLILALAAFFITTAAVIFSRQELASLPSKD